MKNNVNRAKDGIEPTILCEWAFFFCLFCLSSLVSRKDPLKKEVEAENMKRLEELAGEATVFEAEDSSKLGDSSPYIAQLQRSCPAPKKLQLKKGAQVILLRNLNFDKRLVNGARGVVLGFEDTGKNQGCPIIKFASGAIETIKREEWNVELGGAVMATRRQFPLDLAYALSIHKCQGMTIERVVISLENTFEYGQAYVALVSKRKRRNQKPAQQQQRLDVLFFWFRCRVEPPLWKVCSCCISNQSAFGTYFLFFATIRLG